MDDEEKLQQSILPKYRDNNPIVVAVIDKNGFIRFARADTKKTVEKRAEKLGGELNWHSPISATISQQHI